MALHSSLVAAALLQHRKIVPACRAGQGFSLGDSSVG